MKRVLIKVMSLVFIFCACTITNTNTKRPKTLDKTFDKNGLTNATGETVDTQPIHLLSKPKQEHLFTSHCHVESEFGDNTEFVELPPMDKMSPFESSKEEFVLDSEGNLKVQTKQAYLDSQKPTSRFQENLRRLNQQNRGKRVKGVKCEFPMSSDGYSHFGRTN